MSNGIFISYRRQDARMAAGRLADSLKEELDGAQIFRDVETIEPGMDFVEALEKALQGCAVMLAVIGPNWLGMRDEAGKRRLDDPQDWIRLEIVAALQRNVRLVPVLVDGAQMPAADDLPENLRPLLRRQAFNLDDARWASDISRLADTLAKIPPLRRRSGPGPRPAPPAPGGMSKALRIGAGIGAAIAVIGVIGNLMENKPVDSQPEVPATPNPPLNSSPATPARQEVPTPPEPTRSSTISGLWQSASGESYTFAQQGAAVSVAAHYGGNQIGQGSGQFNGSRVMLALTVLVQGVPVLTNCQLDMAADWQSMTGACYTPATGMTTGARIYR